jgi:hypothetical protein
VQRIRRRAGRALVPSGGVVVGLGPGVVQRRERLSSPRVALPEQAGRQLVAEIRSAVLVDPHGRILSGNIRAVESATRTYRRPKLWSPAAAVIQPA